MKFKPEDFPCQCKKRISEIEWQGSTVDYEHFQDCEAAWSASVAQNQFDEWLKEAPTAFTYWDGKKESLGSRDWRIDAKEPNQPCTHKAKLLIEKLK